MKLQRNFKYYNLYKGVRVRPALLSLPRMLTALGIVVFMTAASLPVWRKGQRSAAADQQPAKRPTKRPRQVPPMTKRAARGMERPLSPAIGSRQTLTHKVATTVFWVGEGATSENGFIHNAASAWDETWQEHFGGVDTPDARNGYFPAGFTPKENPFYFALPYSDFTNDGNRRPTAGKCPNAAQLAAQPYSYCKNAWIMIKKGNKVAYAQWEDVGPNEVNDVDYVFGTAQPKNTFGAHAGLDVSPAVRDYLKLQDVDTTEWQFVDAAKVPDGPWKRIVTTSLGEEF